MFYGVASGWFKYVFALVLAIGAGAVTAFWYTVATSDPPGKVVTKTATEKIVPIEYADFVTAYGAPVQVVPGEQVDPSLQGASCGIWQIAGEKTASQILACVAPGAAA